jgi:hypothetical protein
VVHCAAHVWVGESVREPARYYANNTGNAMVCSTSVSGPRYRRSCSVTAAVYGEPGTSLLDESRRPRDQSSRRFQGNSERILLDIAAATGLRYAILRYFNVAGADADARIGGAAPTMPTWSSCLRGRAGPATGHGDPRHDYPTPTAPHPGIMCVDDLSAHLGAQASSCRQSLAGGQLRLRSWLLGARGCSTPVGSPTCGSRAPRAPGAPAIPRSGRRQPTPALSPRLGAQTRRFLLHPVKSAEQALQRHQANAAEG